MLEPFFSYLPSFLWELKANLFDSIWILIPQEAQRFFARLCSRCVLLHLLSLLLAPLGTAQELLKLSGADAQKPGTLSELRLGRRDEGFLKVVVAVGAHEQRTPNLEREREALFPKP